VERDLIRYFGIGNATPGQIGEYQNMEKQFSVRVRVVAVQNHYDLLVGDPAETSGALEYCARTKVSLVAWSPLCRGLITERYLDLSKVGRGDRLFDEGTLQKDATPITMQKLHRLADLAHGWGYEVNQLALAYMLTLPGMGPVIPASSTVTQLESNTRAGKIELSGDQIQQIHTALLS
jgi:aryl-alcohol dehydrogenase-like predicted oxidoreductase